MGLALMMAPLMAAALNAVPRREVPMASSFLNVFQNVGGSLGIALLNTFVTNSIHRHAVGIGEVLPGPSQRMEVRLGLRALGVVFRHEPGHGGPGPDKVAFVASEGIMQRASVLGFENGFVLGGLVLLAAIPICFWLQPAAHHLADNREAGGVFD